MKICSTLILTLSLAMSASLNTARNGSRLVGSLTNSSLKMLRFTRPTASCVFATQFGKSGANLSTWAAVRSGAVQFDWFHDAWQ